MLDLSEEPIEENIETCKRYLERMSKMGMTLEIELGITGGEEDGVANAGELADPKQGNTLADTGIDFMSAGIGNIHGIYPEG
jgi:fructose-bisphosphate aldolase class II